MTDKVSIVKQKKTLIHLYFLDHEPDECPVKTGTGFQTPLKDSAGDEPANTATSMCRVLVA